MAYTHILAGLGNPGRKYEWTRHNIGFHAVDHIVESFLGVSAVWKKNFEAECCDLRTSFGDFLVVKPQTFMNLSGDSVAAAARYYKLEPSSVIVMHDEADIEFGSVKVKLGGGTAGHNGVASVAQKLGSKDFARFRLGIGRPKKRDTDEQGDSKGRGSEGQKAGISSFVLGKFGSEERSKLESFFVDIERGLELYCSQDLKAAQLFLHSR